MPCLWPWIVALLFALVSPSDASHKRKLAWRRMSGKKGTDPNLGATHVATEPLHKTICGGQTCRPGEGNLKGYQHWSMPWEPPPIDVGGPGGGPLSKTAPSWGKGEPFPAARYAHVVEAARRVQTDNFVVLAAADFDFRELGENWYRATQRAGISNGLLYALDNEAFVHFTSRRIPTANGTANLNAWAETRLQRHIQRALAERHMAAAALADAGLDVLLSDTTHVFMRPVLPFFRSQPVDIDVFAMRGACKREPVLGCGLVWNFLFLRGATADAARRERVIRFVNGGIDMGMVDFYLRWWAGHHCIFMGYQKTYKASSPSLDGGLTPQQVAAQTDEALAFVSLSHGPKIGMLPTALFPPPNTRMPASLIARSEKHPDGEARHRLRLDRYDEVDFDHLRAAMVKDGLWFLGAPS